MIFVVFIWSILKKCKNVLRTQPFPKCRISPFPSLGRACTGLPATPFTLTVPARLSPACPHPAELYHLPCPIHNRYGAQVHLRAQLNSDTWALGETAVVRVGGQPLHSAKARCRLPSAHLTSRPHVSLLTQKLLSFWPSLTSTRKPP